MRGPSGIEPILPDRRRGREAEGGGLLNRYTGFNPYRGLESLRLRQLIETITFSCSLPSGLSTLREPGKGQFATALLPFAVSAAPHCGLQGLVHSRRRVFLHARDHVTVEIKRDSDLAMAET